jgi:hypothetical protein
LITPFAMTLSRTKSISEMRCVNSRRSDRTSA